jgi:cytosine/uracil/thiamine/allantoin permease
MKERTLHGSLTFLGFVISVLAVLYFALEYMPRVSDWTRILALILLALMFGFLGAYLRQTSLGEPFFDGPRLRWLRPPVVMYLSAILSGVAAELAFLNVEDLSRPVKILVSLVVGIGLIVAVSRRQRPGRETTDAA